jgi:DNA-binding MarR family transcriptional regulator
MAKNQADELRRIMQRLFRDFGALAVDTTPCGKPLSMAHAHALMVLLMKGELSQQELGTELRIDKSNVARLCARMAEERHIEQRSSAQDGRSRIVSLTSQGKRLAREVDAASLARFGALLGALPAERRIQLIDNLNQLLTAIEAMHGHPIESAVQ